MDKRIIKYIVPVFLLSIPLIFFYKTVLFQNVPIPGDLLLANYEPYKSDTTHGVLPGSFPNKGQGADVIRELYPWKYFTIKELKKGVFPLWNPYTFSGNPHFANLQSGALYPVNVLFFVMPFVGAWSVYIILQYVLMFIFMYFYLREIKLTSIASIFGALALTFSGFMIVWGEYGNFGHTLLWLPLVLLSIEKIINSPKPIWYGTLIASLVFSIFAGYIQLYIYISILAVMYTVCKYFAGERKNPKRYTLIFLSFVVAGLVSAVQLLPLAEFVTLSLRGSYTFKELQERLMPPVNLVTYFAPDFFGNSATANYSLPGSTLERAINIGIWPLLFAIYAISKPLSFYKKFFGVAGVIMLVSALSILPVVYFHNLGIPLLSTGIPTRIFSVISFCFAVLAAIGLDQYLKSKTDKRIYFLLSVFGLVYGTLFAITLLFTSPNLLVSQRNLILPVGIFLSGSIGIIFLKSKKIIIAAVLLFLTLFELFYSFQKFNAFVPASYIYPSTKVEKQLRKIQRIQRVWGYGSANIDANFQIIEGNYTTEGYDALYIKRYGTLISASKNGVNPTTIERTVANIYKGEGPSDLKLNLTRKRALDLFGVGLILNKKDGTGYDAAFDERDYTLLWESQPWQIYKNKNVLPRINLFGNYTIEDSGLNIVKKLYEPAFNIHNTLILEEKLPISFKIKQDSGSTTRIIEYNPNKIILETNSKYDNLLFVSDNYFPGWYATVDKKPEKIYRANYAFRAVPVKAGKHVVTLTYFPDSFKYGLYVSGVTVFGLILILVFVTIRKKHGHNSK